VGSCGETSTIGKTRLALGITLLALVWPVAEPIGAAEPACRALRLGPWAVLLAASQRPGSMGFRKLGAAGALAAGALALVLEAGSPDRRERSVWWQAGWSGRPPANRLATGQTRARRVIPSASLVLPIVLVSPHEPTGGLPSPTRSWMNATFVRLALRSPSRFSSSSSLPSATKVTPPRPQATRTTVGQPNAEASTKVSGQSGAERRCPEHLRCLGYRSRPPMA